MNSAQLTISINAKPRPIGGVFTVEEKVEVKDKSLELIVSSPQNFRYAARSASMGLTLIKKNPRVVMLATGALAPEKALESLKTPLVKTIRNRSVFGTMTWISLQT